MSKTAAGEMTISELAERTGMTVRNIRAHQTRGLLPPPVVRGRTGYYNEEHVARIELTRELQAEGLNLEAIRRMSESVNGSAEEIVGFTRTLRAPFEEETPEIVELAELAELWKKEVEEGRGFEMLERGEKLGTIRSLPDGKVEVISPRMMAAAAALAEVGMSPDAVFATAEKLRRKANEIAQLFTDLFLRRFGSPLTKPVGPRASGRRCARHSTAPARSAPTSSWASSISRWPRPPTKRCRGRSAALPGARPSRPRRHRQKRSVRVAARGMSLEKRAAPT
jgi:DNA-binding transcriptional MerR regulator